MLAVKGIYQNGQIKLTEFLDETKKPGKVVVIFMEETVSKLPESTGFAKEVLDNPAEDVWNDL